MPGADTTLRLCTFQIQSKYKISASCAQTLCRKNKKGYVEHADRSYGRSDVLVAQCDSGLLILLLVTTARNSILFEAAFYLQQRIV